MDSQSLKQAVADAAIAHISENFADNLVVGIGTGSTAECFISSLPGLKDRIEFTVSSSERSTALLLDLGFEVRDLNETSRVDVYVDGADEATRDRHLIKGGGAALTREKIVAARADKFICIADDSKLVDQLGAFPLPVEVIPMARRLVEEALNALGGEARWREGVITDNGNIILDVHGLQMTDGRPLEREINDITGVVCNGIFALRPADLLLIGTQSEILRI